MPGPMYYVRQTLVHMLVHITCGTSVLSGAWGSKKIKVYEDV